MVEHLVIVVLMALVASGAYAVQQEGMLLERLGKFWSMKRRDKWIVVNGKRVPKPYIPSFWQKPLWSCAVCMCSVWGIPAMLCVAPEMWYHLPLYLFASAGLAAYLNR